MKFEIEKGVLSDALSTVTRAMSKKPVIPELSHVFIKVEGSCITFRATDLDVEITRKVTLDNPAEVDGEILAQADTLTTVASKAPSGSLMKVDTVDGRLEIKFGRSKMKISTLQADGFPHMRDTGLYDWHSLEPEIFSDLFSRCAFAVSTEETRYYLNGVYLHSVDGMVKAVATDGHQLGIVEYGFPGEFTPVIVPTKTAIELAKVDCQGEVRFSTSDNKIGVEFGDVSIVSKVIDGTYPDYTRVIPDFGESKFTTDAKSFSLAADRVASLSEDKKTRRVEITLKDNEATLVVDGGVNSALDVVDVEIFGDETKFAVNSKYLANAFKSTKSGDIDVFYNSPGDPLVVRTSGGGEFLAVVMPMR